MAELERYARSFWSAAMTRYARAPRGRASRSDDGHRSLPIHEEVVVEHARRGLPPVHRRHRRVVAARGGLLVRRRPDGGDRARGTRGRPPLRAFDDGDTFEVGRVLACSPPRSDRVHVEGPDVERRDRGRGLVPAGRRTAPGWPSSTAASSGSAPTARARSGAMAAAGRGSSVPSRRAPPGTSARHGWHHRRRQRARGNGPHSRLSGYAAADGRDCRMSVASVARSASPLGLGAGLVFWFASLTPTLISVAGSSRA